MGVLARQPEGYLRRHAQRSYNTTVLSYEEDDERAEDLDGEEDDHENGDGDKDDDDDVHGDEAEAEEPKAGESRVLEDFREDLRDIVTAASEGMGQRTEDVDDYCHVWSADRQGDQGALNRATRYSILSD